MIVSGIYDTIHIHCLGIDDEEEKIEAVRGVLGTLPKRHVEILHYLISFLSRVVQNSQSNKMGSLNVAIVFAPLILYPRDSTFNEYAFRTPSVSSKAQVISYRTDINKYSFFSSLL
jgi:hypothetical protein